MKIISADFILGATNSASYPDHALPEFAFYGKSNVGKSSLINMLLGRNGLAKASATPGLTQQINFFKINNEFCFVDLPGEGYSKLSNKTHKDLKPLVLTYCKTRENLKAVFYLLDLRRDITEQEVFTYQELSCYGRQVVIVGTKEDKLSKNILHQTITKWEKAFNLSKENIHTVSSLNNTGKNALLDIIESRIK